MQRARTVAPMANQGTTLFTHLASRAAAGSTTSLDGAWRAIVDQYDSGYIGLTGGRDPRGFYRDFKPRHEGDRVEYDFDTSMELQVPGDWNTQVPELFWYEGTVWYRLRFTIDEAHDGRTFVHFGAVNHTCRVFVDGEELAMHEGAFGPFAVELGELATPGEHSLVVMAENRRAPERIPAERTDWFNFGGLHRSVTLVRTPETFISSAWLTMDAAGTVVGQVDADGPGDGTGRATATVSIPELDVSAEVAVGERFTPRHRRRPDRTLASGPSSSVRRDVRDRWRRGHRIGRVPHAPHRRRADPRERRTRLLQGHLDPRRGPERWATGERRRRRATLLDWAEELGANFVRLAHYQHDEAMVAEADRRGLMVWAELPVYWGIDWANEATLANALEQTDELVVRDRCHPSVVLWSVANETLPGDERNAFLARLVERVRDLDDTRLVTAALFTLPGLGMETHIDDPLGAEIDVIGVNQYYGWYYGERADIPNKRWTSDVGKPIIFSELGAGAKAGHHGAETQIWTEEFQAAVYDAQIRMIAAQSECAGLSPWILKDFRAPRRQLPGIQDGYNRKGLVSEEGERKLAFDVLADWYRTLD